MSRGEIRIEKLEDRLEPRVPFPHKHDFYQLVWISSGRGWHEVDFERYLVTAGQMFFLKPGQVHAWKIPRARGFVIEFTIESVSRFFVPFQLGSLPDEVTFKDGQECEAVRWLCQLALREFQNEESHFENLLSIHLVGLILLLERKRSAKLIVTPHSTLIGRFQADVETHFREQRQIAFYSKRLGLTAKALTMRLTRATSQSPRDYIMERTILEAKRQLVESQDSIAEIGYQLGFEDPNYFTRFFREKSGLSPTDFRNQRSKS